MFKNVGRGENFSFKTWMFFFSQNVLQKPSQGTLKQELFQKELNLYDTSLASNDSK